MVRAKVERTARELGQAPIVNIDLDFLEKLTPTPWYSLSLFEDRARRILATASVGAALAVIGISFMVWFLASMSMIASRQEYADALKRTETKSMQLMNEVELTRSSPVRDQIGKFLAVNDGLLSLNGFLDIYQIKAQKTRWRAIVPPSATADRITALGGKNIEVTDAGVAIGNDAEIDYETMTKEKK